MHKSNKQKLAEYGPIHARHLHSGIQFVVKYCGSQLIEDIRRGQLFSAPVVSAAIQSLLDFNRKAKRKSQLAVLTLSTRGIALRPGGVGSREPDGPPQVEASIERIGFCTADKRNPRVFGFVARNCVNETVELHVCKCANSKEPVQLAYTLNEAFSIAVREQDVNASGGFHGNRAAGQASADASSSGHAAAGLSVDEQPVTWCQLQSERLASGGGAELGSLQQVQGQNQQQFHTDWVQFS